ncbi:hypothetical protein K7X08_013089 [Anisodus acutangulus]|uniref:tRNA-guanine(15) transglycosylase-like domain-containing protein n=1 Tax=Anisodus acutangulus TaxID=402998 RepID=A0A9Q1MFE3_9SOLA|nr:hypothetical protein K7X08_013089 [Anisodus acutangulus]
MYRTLRWIDRCIAAHKRPHEQNLFGIVQGGLDPVLRDICVTDLVERNLPGYVRSSEYVHCIINVHHLAVKMKTRFGVSWLSVLLHYLSIKPRYVMGVGYPLDIVACSALGADMYDCVYPTRTARFGTALVPEFPQGDVPEWVCNAMEVAGIDISSCSAPFSSLPDKVEEVKQ